MQISIRKWVLGLVVPLSVNAQVRQPEVQPVVPKVWDDHAIATLEVPLANPAGSPKHVSSDFYYRIPVRPVYKTYPAYAPGREPEGYLDWLKQRDRKSSGTTPLTNPASGMRAFGSRPAKPSSRRRSTTRPTALWLWQTFVIRSGIEQPGRLSPGMAGCHMFVTWSARRAPSTWGTSPAVSAIAG